MVGARFEHHGYAFERVDRDHPETWPTLDGAELIVLLGSEWSVYWPDIVEAVEAEAAAIRECVRRDIPIFGICFGSQIAAHALGGRVYQAAHKEIGWYGVDSAHDAIATGPWMQWHSDVVDVPPGAVQLASSDVGPQAWHVGRTFCTQFHPEVTGEVVERWVRGAAPVRRPASAGTPSNSSPTPIATPTWPARTPTPWWIGSSRPSRPTGDIPCRRVCERVHTA